MVSVPERRRAVTHLRAAYSVSERRACTVIPISRTTYRHSGTRPVVDETYTEVVRLSHQYPYWGYRKIFALMDQDRFEIGREGVRLIRRRDGLQVVRKRRKKRVLGRSTHWVHRASHPNHVWSYDFVHDRTIDGKSLRCLTIVDEFTREGLAIRCARSLTASDVVRVLEELIGRCGKPQCIRSDNGPEFVADAVKSWLSERSIGTHYIEPGSPWQNPYGESFNSIFRTTCLDRWAFESVAESRAVISHWLTEYNTIRPHGSLNGKPPAQFIKEWASSSRDSTMQQKRNP